jgi:hypothetical protein
LTNFPRESKPLKRNWDLLARTLTLRWRPKTSS